MICYFRFNISIPDSDPFSLSVRFPLCREISRTKKISYFLTEIQRRGRRSPGLSKRLRKLRFFEYYEC